MIALLDDLEKKARAATPGPWIEDIGDGYSTGKVCAQDGLGTILFVGVGDSAEPDA